jgi:hypothetical protein
MLAPTPNCIALPLTTPPRVKPLLPALQFIINDGGGFGDSPMRRSHERLIRKLLSYRNHPEVVEFVFYMWPGIHNNIGWVLDLGPLKGCMHVVGGVGEQS